MIDFACKKFDLNEVIRCGLGLSKAEYNIFKFFISNTNKTSTPIIVKKTLNLELSTIQRAVKKLHDLNILQRNQTNLSSGGYVFSYKIKSKNEIKNKILEVISSWKKRVESELDSW
jgi:predicted transcriptional regulator